ncbi:MAG TPA: LamG domain-containing protein, partial [Flavobacteriales bacterium]|nr:LamG domain-containing protein [Flavobacteriales bacterium]
VFPNASGRDMKMGPCDITTGTGDALTLACWMRPDLASVNEKMLLAKTTGNTGSDMIWSLSVVNVSAVRFRVRTGASTLELTSSPSSVLTGTWYHVAATYDGMDLVLYVNGAQVASMSGAGLLGYHPQAPATMGSLSDGSQTFFGRLDDVRIYDRALEQSEVIDLVIGSIATSVPDPLSALVHANGLLTGLPPGVVVDLEVRDMLGRLEHRDVLTPSCTTYDLDGLAPGYHLICLATPGSRTVLPFLRP